MLTKETLMAAKLLEYVQKIILNTSFVSYWIASKF